MVRLYLCCFVRLHFRRTRDKQMYTIKYIVKTDMRDWECLTYKKEDSDGLHTHTHTLISKYLKSCSVEKIIFVTSLPI